MPSIAPPTTAGGMSVSKIAHGIKIGQKLEMIVKVYAAPFQPPLPMHVPASTHPQMCD